MASGRPRRPNDPSLMAGVETALRTVARAEMSGLIRNWRNELGLSAGLAVVALASGYAIGAVWLVAIAAIGLVVLAAGLAWPPSRQRLIRRTWCVITPRRVRTGCKHAWIQTRDGGLPIILYTTPAAFGERVTLWCRAGITRGDLEAARDVLRAACWASDVRLVTIARYAQVVVLDVIRRPPPEPRAQHIASWPYLNRGSEADPEEPALFGGPGHHRPFG